MMSIWEWTFLKCYERYKRETPKNLKSRIVGGYSPKARPWMALIEMQQEPENKLKGHAQCGGAIINKVNFLSLIHFQKIIIHNLLNSYFHIFKWLMDAWITGSGSCTCSKNLKTPFFSRYHKFLSGSNSIRSKTAPVFFVSKNLDKYIR